MTPLQVTQMLTMLNDCMISLKSIDSLLQVLCFWEIPAAVVVLIAFLQERKKETR